MHFAMLRSASAVEVCDATAAKCLYRTSGPQTNLFCHQNYCTLTFEMMNLTHLNIHPAIQSILYYIMH